MEQNGHFAKLCRSKQRTERKMRHVHPESEVTSEEDDCSPNKIHLTTRTVQSTKQTLEDTQPLNKKNKSTAWTRLDETT